ncbi:hypothetical protein RRG08_063451 [Elysia crispata]|uniref:Uncharacterized protein n=1 Tax=Elysia crispata TaxID=231223 RepID=A0AAE1AA56_9GAST|nr:hypothetical protein RRG08_063451 [Elysia crispata]
MICSCRIFPGVNPILPQRQGMWRCPVLRKSGLYRDTRHPIPDTRYSMPRLVAKLNNYSQQLFLPVALQVSDRGVHLVLYSKRRQLHPWYWAYSEFRGYLATARESATKTSWNLKLGTESIPPGRSGNPCWTAGKLRRLFISHVQLVTRVMLKLDTATLIACAPRLLDVCTLSLSHIHLSGLQPVTRSRALPLSILVSRQPCDPASL